MFGMSESEMRMFVEMIILKFRPQWVKRTRNAITMMLAKEGEWCPPVQFILRGYHTKAQILLGFDNDACALGFDGENVWVTETGLFGLKNRVNVVDLELAGAIYECRLMKYAQRGIAVYVPSLDQSKIDLMKAMQPYEKKGLKGLSWLLAALLFNSPKPAQVDGGYEYQGSFHYELKGETFDSFDWEVNEKIDGLQVMMVSNHKGQTFGVAVKRCTSLKQLDIVEPFVDERGPLRLPTTVQFIKMVNGARFACAFNPVHYDDIQQEWYKGVLYA